jgi:hypothetical protein
MKNLKKYNKNFQRDVKWYLQMRNILNFDGCSEYINKKGKSIIIYDKNGVSGIEAFFQYDSNGIIKPTKHVNLLYTLLKVKGSVNLHIKMYSEDRAKNILSLNELKELSETFKAPEWFYLSVEKQKSKYKIDKLNL